MKQAKYYVVKKNALPEVFLKVVEVKRLLMTEKNLTIQEATERVGISRSSFYKYKDDIFPFHETEKGQTITILIQMDDKPGILMELLGIVSVYEVNILTIHQSIPLNRVASATLSLEFLSAKNNITRLFERMERVEGVHYLKVVGRE